MVASLLFTSVMVLTMGRGVALPVEGSDPAIQARAPGGAAFPVTRLRARELVTGGAHPADPLPLVVVLHGRGGGADGFMRRFLALGMPARVIALEAPRSLPHAGGHAWLSGRAKNSSPEDVVRELGEAADTVSLELQRLVEDRPTLGSPILVGYSQGGMVALALAAGRPDSVGEVITAASYLPEALSPARTAGPTTPRVRMVHARGDTMVAHAWARQTEAGMRAASWDVELRTVGQGHQLDMRGWGRVMVELRHALAERNERR